MRGEGVKIVLGIFLLIVLVSFVSAGFSDWFKFTGKAINQPTNVTVNVVGASQSQITYVSPISAVSPLESTSTDVVFSVIVSDPDGVSDINDSSVNALFSFNGEQREDLSCSLVGDLDATSANYTCTIAMWYWDTPGSWIINVSANDIGNLTTSYNDTTSFTYNQLKAMVISPDSLTWGSLPSGTASEKADNDPTIVNNTGNYDGTIDITGINLLGETNPSELLPVNNFTADPSDGSVCASGTGLVNNTGQTIVGTVSNPGNISLGGGVGQEEIYYCIPNVPLISSQTYSTSQGGSWTVSY